MSDKTRLDMILDQEGETIIDLWARALHNLSGTHYAGLPLLEDLEQHCRSAFEAYRAFIQTQDHHLLRVFVTEAIRQRTQQNFSLHEIERALLIVKAIVRPRLLARYAGQADPSASLGQAIAAFSADWQRFEQATDVAFIASASTFTSASPPTWNGSLRASIT